jgi:outer membrane lipoprotein-sorting protein
MKTGVHFFSFSGITRRVKMQRSPLCCLMFLVVLSGFAQQGKDDRELQRVLGKMDAVAKTFRSFTADFSQKKYTAILKEFDAPETGEFCYAREKDGAVLMRHEVKSPGKRILTIKGETLTIYRPAIKEAQIASRQKMRDIVEYLTLGIGQSSAKLREKFQISYKGSEIIDNERCSMLIFIPKEAKVAAQVASMTIWIKDSSGTPAQYRFEEPSQDYLLITFTAEKVNTKIAGSKFEQKLPADTEKQKL